MHQAQLHLGVGEHRFDGLGDSLQAIDTGNQNVFDAAILKLGDH